MISLALGLAVLTTGFQQPAQPQAGTDTVTIKRTYKEKDTKTYAISVKLDVGQPLELDSDIIYKVGKILPDDKATVDLDVDHFASNVGSGEPPATFSSTFDKCGMGESLTGGNGEVVYAIFELMQLVPGKDLKVGDDFTFDYKLSEGSFTGKGKLKAVRTEDGKQVADIEYSCDVLPPQGSEATLRVKSVVNLDDGTIVKSEGSFEQGEATGVMTLKVKPKP